MPVPRSRAHGLIGVALGALGLLGLVVAPAGAQTDPSTSSTTSKTGGQPPLSQLAPGLEILNGTITGNGPESGRTLDSSQATAFVQAWLPDSVFGTPPFQDPPPTLPVYQVQAEYKYQGTLGSMTVNYASDGTSAWVSMPPQTLWPGVVVTQQRWILAPDRTVAGFEGRLTPQSIPTGAPGSHGATPATASDSSLSTTQLLIIAGLVVLVAGTGLLVLRRRRAQPTNR
jgi:LPXTG-motif cell wall-anchored protein